MGGEGSFPQLARNIKGLVNYVEVLVTGTGPGSTTGRPLGNKFFLKTAGTCKDVASKKVVPRYIYVNNVPNGNIPLISGAMGTNFSSFKGLVPGTMQNLNALNPMGFIAAFGAGSQPACRSLTMETVDNNDARRRETRFVADIDIKEMDPCYWGNGRKNPLTGRRCRESFVETRYDNDTPLPRNMWIQVYLVLLIYPGFLKVENRVKNRLIPIIDKIYVMYMNNLKSFFYFLDNILRKALELL